LATTRGKAREEEQLSRVFHCLADPARRKIIALLREAGELPVGGIGEAFAMTLNGVSKHVKVMERAGLVRRRVEGRVHWISVDWGALQSAYEFLHAHHHFWSRRLDALVDYTHSQPRPRKERS
jgi:DNA-binding transcriptional ArsR family regulator